jgi:hypothetical protein
VAYADIKICLDRYLAHHGYEPTEPVRSGYVTFDVNSCIHRYLRDKSSESLRVLIHCLLYFGFIDVEQGGDQNNRYFILFMNILPEFNAELAYKKYHASLLEKLNFAPARTFCQNIQAALDAGSFLESLEDLCKALLERCKVADKEMLTAILAPLNQLDVAAKPLAIFQAVIMSIELIYRHVEHNRFLPTKFQNARYCCYVIFHELFHYIFEVFQKNQAPVDREAKRELFSPSPSPSPELEFEGLNLQRPIAIRRNLTPSTKRLLLGPERDLFYAITDDNIHAYAVDKLTVIQQIPLQKKGLMLHSVRICFDDGVDVLYAVHQQLKFQRWHFLNRGASPYQLVDGKLSSTDEISRIEPHSHCLQKDREALLTAPITNFERYQPCSDARFLSYISAAAMHLYYLEPKSHEHFQKHYVCKLPPDVCWHRFNAELQFLLYCTHSDGIGIIDTQDSNLSGLARAEKKIIFQAKYKVIQADLAEYNEQQLLIILGFSADNVILSFESALGRPAQHVQLPIDYTELVVSGQYIAVSGLKIPTVIYTVVGSESALKLLELGKIQHAGSEILDLQIQPSSSPKESVRIYIYQANKVCIYEVNKTSVKPVGDLQLVNTMLLVA